MPSLQFSFKQQKSSYFLIYCQGIYIFKEEEISNKVFIGDVLRPGRFCSMQNVSMPKHGQKIYKQLRIFAKQDVRPRFEISFQRPKTVR